MDRNDISFGNDVVGKLPGSPGCSPEKGCVQIRETARRSLQRAIRILNLRTNNTATWMRIHKRQQFPNAIGIDGRIRVNQEDVSRIRLRDRGVASAGESKIFFQCNYTR